MKDFFRVYLFFSLLVTGVGCQTVSKNFVQRSDSKIVHVPTGIEYPKVIRGWESSEPQISENVTPEILAELTYVQQDVSKEFKPRVSVFFMKGNSTANLQMIENKEVLSFQKPEKIKSDLGMNLPRHQQMFMSSYRHSSQQILAAGGSTVLKDIPLSSFFVQSKKNPQLVFLMTTAQKQTEDQKDVLQLMDQFLSKK